MISLWNRWLPQLLPQSGRTSGFAASAVTRTWIRQSTETQHRLLRLRPLRLPQRQSSGLDMGSTTSASSVDVICWRPATGKRVSGSDCGQPDSVVRPPAVPLVDRLTSGKPSAGNKPTATRTETAAPTAVIADVVNCSENTHTPTDIHETPSSKTHVS